MLINFITRRLGTSGVTFLSFFFLVVFIAILLSLPDATVGAKRLAGLDVIFVATSAVCVTGLSTFDTSADLSFFGQFIILLGMQVGGLGLMTFSTVTYSFIGTRMPIINRVILEETFLVSPMKQARLLFIYVLQFTIGCELIGTMLLTGYWYYFGKFESFGITIWYAFFHSVSAFTNGSFALFSNSLGDFTDDPFVVGVISSLILLGGIGFFVSYELQNYFRKRITASKPAPKLSIQSKLTLFTTFYITVIGATILFVLERNGAFESHSPLATIMNSLFYTIAPRTAGFETIPLTEFSGQSLLIIMILMFIGAGAGSTGGGIKIGTAGVIIAYFISRFRGYAHLSLWKRTIPQRTIDKAMALVAAFSIMVIGFTVLVMFSESGKLSGAESQSLFLPILFEVISALSTVGFSLGATEDLTPIGKVILTVVMFAGRISPLIIIVKISSRERRQRFKYSEENIMVG